MAKPAKFRPKPKRHLTALLFDPALWRQLKIAAAEEGSTVTAILTRLATRYLAARPGGTRGTGGSR